jgi:hypothetical protein
VDPQSTLLHNPTNVLETPSLKDVSECTFHDVSRGEAAVERHAAVPTRVNAMAPSWSPIPVKHVADGGVVRDSPLITTSLGLSFSSPSLGDERESHTSISPYSQPTVSPESGDLPASDQRSSMIPAHYTPPAGISDMFAVPIQLPNGRFSCPQCPRKFSSFAKARCG